ncbi:unnamed protein product [Durusdinium trenchii]|uniref:Uncharacterized protein n=2 Tax=Durusdinium trenchii TaxID=1381693 RepID=A0ABP0RNR3_9DINO
MRADRARRAEGPPRTASQGRRVAEAEAADVEESFCLSWEQWSEELVLAIAQQQPWPLPPELPSRLSPPLTRMAEAVMNGLAAVWGCDVECKRLAQEVEELQRTARSARSGRSGAREGRSSAPERAGGLGMEEQQELAQALLSEEQEVGRLREQTSALSEQLASARASLWKVKEREMQISQFEVEQKAQLVSAKRQEASARQQFQDRESELRSLRLQVEEVSAQLAKKDAVHASLGQQLREAKKELQQSELQRQKLLTALKEYLSSMEEKFEAAKVYDQQLGLTPEVARRNRWPK